MFRKAKQRSLRGRTDTDNNEDDQGNVSDSQPPSIVIQQQTVTTKTVVKKTDVPKSLLSFGDDDGKAFVRALITFVLNPVNRRYGRIQSE